MNTAFLATAIFLAALAFLALYRAYAGPGAADRILAINVIATEVAVMIALLSIITNQSFYMDVALIFASYSLVMATIWLILRAPDIAMAEAAIGAGVTSIMFIATISRTNRLEK